jgi:hypothetical protein
MCCYINVHATEWPRCGDTVYSAVAVIKEGTEIALENKSVSVWSSDNTAW